MRLIYIINAVLLMTMTGCLWDKKPERIYDPKPVYERIDLAKTDILAAQESTTTEVKNLAVVVAEIRDKLNESKRMKTSPEGEAKTDTPPGSPPLASTARVVTVNGIKVDAETMIEQAGRLWTHPNDIVSHLVEHGLDRDELAVFTLDELEKLHTFLHDKGDLLPVGAMKSEPKTTFKPAYQTYETQRFVQRTMQANCPNGRCPTSVSVQRVRSWR
jgi:hypothetical protein